MPQIRDPMEFNTFNIKSKQKVRLGNKERRKIQSY